MLHFILNFEHLYVSDNTVMESRQKQGLNVVLEESSVTVTYDRLCTNARSSGERVTDLFLKVYLRKIASNSICRYFALVQSICIGTVGT